MALVQISTERVRANRVPRGTRPVFEMDLEDHQHVAGVSFIQLNDNDDRVTCDHVAHVTVVTRLGAPVED